MPFGRSFGFVTFITSEAKSKTIRPINNGITCNADRMIDIIKPPISTGIL